MKKQTTITETIDARIIKVLADYSEYDADELSECMLDIKKLFQEEMSSLAQEVEKMKGTAKNHEWEQVRRQAWGYDEAISQVLQLIRERGRE